MINCDQSPAVKLVNGEPVKVWQLPLNEGKSDEWKKGARDVWNGMKAIRVKKSSEYCEGRRTQIEMLPKKEGRTKGKMKVNWSYHDRRFGWVINSSGY